MKHLILATALLALAVAGVHAKERFVCTGDGPCFCFVSTAKQSIRPDALVSVTCVNPRLATRKFYDWVSPAAWKQMGEQDSPSK